jgi:hypothetical protein
MIARAAIVGVEDKGERIARGIANRAGAHGKGKAGIGVQKSR